MLKLLIVMNAGFSDGGDLFQFTQQIWWCILQNGSRIIRNTLIATVTFTNWCHLPPSLAPRTWKEINKAGSAICFWPNVVFSLRASERQKFIIKRTIIMSIQFVLSQPCVKASKKPLAFDIKRSSWLLSLKKSSITNEKTSHTHKYLHASSLTLCLWHMLSHTRSHAHATTSHKYNWSVPFSHFLTHVQLHTHAFTLTHLHTHSYQHTLKNHTTTYSVHPHPWSHK